MTLLKRRPPTAVRRALRQEVGFGCPMAECGNPYLEYHHFDPPWAQEQHHDPERMVALCATHHAKAAALTVEQCRDLKRQPFNLNRAVVGRFDWLRHDLLAIVGGNYYYETPQIVVLGQRPLIWFNRDDRRHLLLNLNMPSIDGVERTTLVDNDWTVEGSPVEVDSPPNGSRLAVKYPDGDSVSVQFRQWSIEADLTTAHPALSGAVDFMTFPLNSVAINLKLPALGIELLPRKSVFGGSRGIIMTDCFMSHCGTGVHLG